MLNKSKLFVSLWLGMLPRVFNPCRGRGLGPGTQKIYFLDVCSGKKTVIFTLFFFFFCGIWPQIQYPEPIKSLVWTGVLCENYIIYFWSITFPFVRQRCVLSPRLFSAVLEMALSSETEGLSLENGLWPLLDLRFADEILVFCITVDKAWLLLDELLASLAELGFTLNVEKKTTQAPLHFNNIAFKTNI